MQACAWTRCRHTALATWSLGGRLFFTATVNSDTLTDYYDVKQSQFTKPTPEPRASDSEESNEVFDRAIR